MNTPLLPVALRCVVPDSDWPRSHNVVVGQKDLDRWNEKHKWAGMIRSMQHVGGGDRGITVRHARPIDRHGSDQPDHVTVQRGCRIQKTGCAVPDLGNISFDHAPDVLDALDALFSACCPDPDRHGRLLRRGCHGW